MENILTIEKALEKVYGMPFETIIQKTRKGGIVEVRQVGMFFSWANKNETKQSLVKIGEHYGVTNHATVLHAVKHVRNLLSLGYEVEFRMKVELFSVLTGIKYKHLL